MVARAKAVAKRLLQNKIFDEHFADTLSRRVILRLVDG